MPRYDRTGPMGAGPGTGWGRGNRGRRPGLSGFSGPEVAGGMVPTGGPGRSGADRRFGLCRWWQGLWASSQGPTEEAQTLKATISAMKAEIAAMEARLAELEKKA